MITFRPMRSGDIAAGLSLCRSYGWNQLARDWELFLSANPDGSCVAEESGKVVGTAATLRYDHFSWIGMVLVDPERQRQGIGRGLLQEALRMLVHERVIKLDATPEGRAVYLTMNFTDEYRLGRMHADNVSSFRLPSSAARPLRTADFPQLLALDGRFFGSDRRVVLDWIWKGAPQYGFVKEEGNQITGYCFGRPGHRFTHVGPVIAQNHRDAIELVSAVLRNCTASVILDVPQHTAEWMQWLTSLGFTQQRTLIRMYRGTDPGPAVPEKQFAILGPEFG